MSWAGKCSISRINEDGVCQQNQAAVKEYRDILYMIGNEVAKMKIQMKRDLKDHYLVLSDRETESLNSYQTRMLDENRISGLLACHVEQIDDEIMLYYNVTSRQTLSEIVADRLIDMRLLRLVLESLLDTLHGISEFLLPPEGMVLDPDCIFADSLLSEIRFCYFPGGRGEFGDLLRALGEFILPKLNHDDREAVLLGYSFYQSCVTDMLTEETFARLLYGERDENPEENGSFGGTQTNEAVRKPEETGVEKWNCGNEEASEMLMEEERDERRRQILDDFFSDEEEEEENPEMKKTIRSIAGAAIIAAAAAFAMIVAGRKDFGIGIGILIFSGTILAGRIRKKIHEKKAGDVKINGEKQPEPTECIQMPDYLVNHYSSMMKSGNKVSETGYEDEYGDDPGGRSDRRRTDRNRGDGETDISMWDNRSDTECAGNGETVLLSDYTRKRAKVRGRLIRLDDRNEKPYILTADEYRIGKSEFASDIVLPSEAVSRLHAKLIWKEDHYEIRDMRSKNATFINETMVDEGENVALKDGDCCRFADLVYRYRTGSADAV